MNESQTAAALRGSFLESVLLEINERGGSMLLEDFDLLAGGTEQTSEAMTELRRENLVAADSDYDEVRLTPFGSRTAALIRTSMLSGARRADMVQRAVLTWLNGKSIEPSSLDEFMVQPEALLTGHQTTPREVHEAGELLVVRGFVAVLATGEATWLRPSITADGRAALMSDVMITEYGMANATVVTNDYSSKIHFNHSSVAGVISGGQSHTQNVVQTISATQTAALRTKVAELTEIAASLPDDEQGTTLKGTLQTLRDEVAGDAPRESTVKDLLFKALGAAAVASGTQAGQQLLAGLSQAAQLVGLN